MSTIADFEAILQKRHNPNIWAAYARALNGRGDPRGNVMAIDLEIDQHGVSPERTTKKRDALMAWLGTDGIDGGSRITRTMGKRHWTMRRFKYGLLDDFGAAFGYPNFTYIAALYASPAGRYLRGISMHGTNLGPESFDRLTAEPHPWLQRLELNQFTKHAPSRQWCNDFARMTPNLTELKIVGRGPTIDGTVSFEFAHPHVRRLIVERSPIPISQKQFPGVEELDVRMGELAQHIDDLPQVSRLDLSRTDPERFFMPDYLPDRIQMVRIPAPRDVSARDRIRKIADQRPEMQIEVFGAYDIFQTQIGSIARPNVREFETRPWIPIGAPGRDVNDFKMITFMFMHTLRLDLSIEAFTMAMEENYEQLDSATKSIWREFWTHIAAIEAGAHTREIKADKLLRCFESLDDTTVRRLVGDPKNYCETWGECALKLRAETNPDDDVFMLARMPI